MLLNLSFKDANLAYAQHHIPSTDADLGNAKVGRVPRDVGVKDEPTIRPNVELNVLSAYEVPTSAGRYEVSLVV